MSYKPTGSITFNQHWMKLTAQKKEKKENRTRKVLFKVVFPCKKDNQTDMSCIHFFTQTTDQFQYVKIQPKIIHLSRKHQGISPTNSVVIP